jgi:flagellar hook-associated protein 3 FlgL
MRVTDALIREAMVRRVALAQSRLFDLEEQTASGRRVVSPEDDATATAIARRLDAALADLASYDAPSRMATNRLETADGTLHLVFEELLRVQEVAMVMSNGTSSDEDRVLAADQVEEIRATIVTLGNTTHEGAYLFGGLTTDVAPFLPDGTWVGNPDVPQVEISPGVRIDAAPDGEEVFTAAGGIDVMGVVTRVRDALAAGDEDLVADLLSQVDVALEQISSARARLGPAINRIAAAGELRDNLRVQLTGQRSDEIDADLPETLSSLTLASQSLEAALTVTARSLDLTLLDKLR